MTNYVRSFPNKRLFADNNQSLLNVFEHKAMQRNWQSTRDHIMKWTYVMYVYGLIYTYFNEA